MELLVLALFAFNMLRTIIVVFCLFFEKLNLLSELDNYLLFVKELRLILLHLLLIYLTQALSGGMSANILSTSCLDQIVAVEYEFQLTYGHL